MRVAVLLLAAVLLAGCGSSRPVRKRPAARIPGRLFAADAGRRKRGRAALHQPRCRWASYRKVIVAPVTVWQSPATANIHDADLKAAADYLYAQLRNELGKDFELVDQPGPDTLCVEAALTGAKAANQTMVVVSSVVPIGAAISGSYEYVTGKPTFQGQAAAEARVTDAQSGAVLGRGGRPADGGPRVEFGDHYVDRRQQHPHLLGAAAVLPAVRAAGAHGLRAAADRRTLGVPA
jgi:hypothetical protein